MFVPERLPQIYTWALDSALSHSLQGLIHSSTAAQQPRMSLLWRRLIFLCRALARRNRSTAQLVNRVSIDQTRLPPPS
jgi:hypothetical protein